MDALPQHRLTMPLIVLPDHAAALLDAAHHLGQQLDAAGPRGPRPAPDRVGPVGGYQVQDGTALIPIMGALVPRTGFLGPRYGVTGYDCITAEVARAVEDEAVQRIALMVDSPGGFVLGVDAAAAAIRAARARKPVLAVVDGQACSAAYWLAAQASAIAAPPLATLGSIGVVMAHVDATGAMAKAGIKVTLITSGERKADGHPLNPLSDDARATAKARADKIRNTFAADVGSGRPAFGARRALATEADTYDGEDAVKLGLADHVLHPAEALSRFAAGAIGVRPPGRSAGAPFLPAPAGASSASEFPDMTTYAEGAKAAQDRISAILDSPHARGRDALARRLAFKSTMSAEDAIATLQDASQATTAVGDTAAFTARTGATEQTLVGLQAAYQAGGLSPGLRQKATIDAAGIYAARRREMGQA